MSGQVTRPRIGGGFFFLGRRVRYVLGFCISLVSGKWMVNCPISKRWILLYLYPIFIDFKKTAAERRQIGLSKACQNRTCVEIGNYCNCNGLSSGFRDGMKRSLIVIKKKKSLSY